MELELVREERDLEKTEPYEGDNTLVKELLEARELFLGRENKIKEIAKQSRNFKDMPVISTDRGSVNQLKEEEHEKTVRELIRDGKRLRGFGAAINLDGSLAANMDRANSRADRAGFDGKEEKIRLRQITLDHTNVYRNPTEAEKAAGISRQYIYDPQDKRNQPVVINGVVYTVADMIDRGIDWSRYDKWNEAADAKKREEIEERELYINTREEREREYEEEKAKERDR